MGMQILIGNSNNIFTYAFDTTAKTVKISNVNNFPLDLGSLVSIYNNTRSLAFDMLQHIEFSWEYVSGFPVYTWEFERLPAASANGDTLYIIIDIPVSQADYSVSLEIAGATI